MPFVAGENVGPYRIIHQVGQGGMATVYKAYHAALDRFVAIKALHPALMDDSTFLARFQREARLVAKLEHANIVPTYDFASYEGRPYLVMKYIEGITLKARLDQGQLSLEEIVPIVNAVGAALTYAHSQDILHRDVKPSNVLLASDGQIYLADFGLARIAQGSSSTLTADMLVGTPQYISPEQAMSKPDLDTRTDIYSFGVMLYEMVVGRVPFSADTPYSIIHDHIYTPLPMPREVNPAVSAPVQQVLLKALAKNPIDRFASIADMVHAFQSAVSFTATSSIANSAPAEISTLQHETEFPKLSSPEAVSVPAPAPSLADPPAVPSARSPQAAFPKKKLPVWVIAMLSILLFLVLTFFITRIAANVSGQQKARHTAAAQPAVTLSAPAADASTVSESNTPGVEKPAPTQSTAPLANDLQKMLDKAVNTWNSGNTDAFKSQLAPIEKAIGDNPTQLSQVLDVLASMQAWPTAAILGGNYLLDHPSESNLRLMQQMHEALYKAAADAGMGAFFNSYTSLPLMSVPVLRYQLLSGAPILDVKDSLDKLTNQPLFAKRFPEAKLLEAEVLIKQNNPDRAQKTLDELSKERLLPEWIRQEANSLAAQTKS